MKKFLSLLLVFLFFVGLNLINVQDVNASSDWEYEEILVDGNHEYVLYYKKTGRTEYSFENYTEIMAKPISGSISGDVTVTNYSSHIISGSLEINSQAGVLFAKVGFKISIGASYEWGASTSARYNWEYKSTDYGDYAIYGVRREATEYFYQIHRRIYKQVWVKDGKNSGHYEEVVEIENTPIESGYFWRHYKIGEIGLFAFPTTNYYEVLNALNIGKFSPYLKYARTTTGGGAGGTGGGVGGGGRPPIFEIAY